MILILSSYFGFSQNEIIVATNTGYIINVDIDACEVDSICNLHASIFDIAINSKREIFITDGKKIFQVDTTNCTYYQINLNPLTDYNYGGGDWLTSLVCLDDIFLFSVSSEGVLYKINNQKGTHTIIDTLVHGSSGDLTWYNGKLILSANANFLVEIELDESFNTLISENVIDSMPSPNYAIYSTTTIGSQDCDGEGIRVLAIEHNNFYTVNMTNAQLTPICENAFDFWSNGAASSTEVIRKKIINISFPNIFTPNHDGINDYFKTFTEVSNVDIQIFNRWGNIVFESNNFLKWNGEYLNSGKICSKGVYYYIGHYSDECNNQKSFNGIVQIAF